MSKTILFFGNEKLATGIETHAEVFKGLIEASYDIRALIIAQPLDRRAYQLEIVRTARQHNIAIKSYQNLKESVGELSEFNVDTAVLAAYGKIVPAEVLDIFSTGIINIHPSLLPKHRGPTPIESTILNGDKKAGVSIMRLAKDMDAGPIYRQQAIDLIGNESKQALTNKLDNLGKDLLLGCLDDIVADNLEATPQPTEGATYDKLISKSDGILDWRDPWVTIDRKVRAFSGWPKARSSVGSIEIAINKVHYEDKQGEAGHPIVFNDQLAIFCQDGLVAIDELTPAGSKTMSSKDFLLGYSKHIIN